MKEHVRTQLETFKERVTSAAEKALDFDASEWDMDDYDDWQIDMSAFLLNLNADGNLDPIQLKRASSIINFLII